MAPAADVVQALESLEGALPSDAIGMVLGSGLGAVAEVLEPRASIPYAEVPGFPQCKVGGHAGMLHAGQIAGIDTIVFEGRSHLYENDDLAAVTFQARLLAALGARALILTSAAGGVHARCRAGDLVFVRDHINLTGRDPWRMIPFEVRSPAFPPGRERYHPVLFDRLCTLAFHLGVKYHPGVLAGVLGPSYETPAEVRALAAMGADVVCMSTVLEAMTASNLGIPVAAIAVVTNSVSDAHGATHDAVIQVSGSVSQRLREFLVTAIGEIDWNLS